MTPKCLKHHDRPATYHAIYKSKKDESRAFFCDECAAQKAALKSPYLSLNKLAARPDQRQQ